MTPEVQAALDRMMQGQGHADDADVLRQALLRLAPASPEYRQISAVMGGPPEPPLQERPYNDPLAEAWGSGPTMDWALQFQPGSESAMSRTNEPLVQNRLSVSEQVAQQQRAAMQTQAAVAPDSPAAQADAGSLDQSEENPYYQAGSHNTNFDLRGYKHDPRDNFIEMPEDFSGMTAESVGMLFDNNAAFLNRFAQSEGGGANMAAYLADPYKAARAMSQVGNIGSDSGGSLYGGAGKSQATVLQDTTNFLREYEKPGNMVDSAKIYQDMLERANNTDYTERINPQSGLPYTPDEIINTTNQALMAASAFMPADSQEWMDGILQQAGQEYIIRVSSGEIDPDQMSYPMFLRVEKGLGDLLG